MICASLCIYLLIGVLWAGVYSLITVPDPAAFEVPMVAGNVARFDSGHGSEAVDYSLTTLTTLGYAKWAGAPSGHPAHIRSRQAVRQERGSQPQAAKQSTELGFISLTFHGGARWGDRNDCNSRPIKVLSDINRLFLPASPVRR